MFWFRGKKKAKSNRRALEQKLQDIRDKENTPLADHDITGVMSLAFERLSDATAKTMRVTTEAADDMRRTGLRVAHTQPTSKDRSR